MAGELERPSGRDGAAAGDASRPTSKIPASAPETTTAAAPATQGSPPDAPMDIAESAAEPGRDLDVHMALRQPKRRRSPEDVELAATFDQPVSGRTCEICGLLWVTDGNGKEKAENGSAGGLSGHFGAQRGEPRGVGSPSCSTRARKSMGTSWGQLLSEGAVRETRGREIGLMADHRMYDIVARGAARGMFVRAKWARRLGKERDEITSGCSAAQVGKT